MQIANIKRTKNLPPVIQKLPMHMCLSHLPVEKNIKCVCTSWYVQEYIDNYAYLCFIFCEQDH